MADKTPEHVSDLDEAHQRVVRRALDLARQGPTVLHRRGARQVKPWQPPEHVVFEHPDFGLMQAHLTSQAVYKEDLPDDEKAQIRVAARAKFGDK